jgi:transcriptional regulator with GAF, ATPase, and Fis domain
MARSALAEIDLTKDLKQLVQPAPGEDGIDDLLRRGLDWMSRVVPYDLAAIFELRGQELVMRAARGHLADERVRGMRLALSAYPTIREAIETRRARAFTEHDHKHGDGDPFDGVLDLPPGHSCMVVPLCAADSCFGVATLDRSVCQTYAPEVVELVEVYGQVLAIAIMNADQKLALDRLHRQDHEHLKLLEAEHRGDSVQLLARSGSALVQDLVRRARQVAATDTAVLILGETGTGKERLARAIHEWSARADQTFVSLNCAAIPAGLLESELFGHVKGAFTGATRDRAGRFQIANGGTLLLDEIAEIPFELQAKLLRVLQQGCFEPVGSDRTLKVSVRVLVATHVDLVRAIEQRRFREDLYYRLNVFPLQLPALRERLQDLPLACEVLLAEQAQRTGRRGMRVTREGLAKLMNYSWPGNLRELGNVLERATILSGRDELGPEVLDLPEATSGTGTRAAAAPSGRVSVQTLAEVQREHIRRVLELTQGKIYGDKGAARLLGLKPSTLQSRMKKLGLERRVVLAGAE